jgi:phosphate uptake regulator
MATPVPRSRKSRAATPVVDLATARSARRLRELQARCRAVDETNRKSLVRLFQTGLVYTRQGARLGRDLLLAHQHLLRVADLLARICEADGAGPGETTALYDEAQGLLARTAELTARTGLVLARGQ